MGVELLVCKGCGGKLKVCSTVCECEYCGTVNVFTGEMGRQINQLIQLKNSQSIVGVKPLVKRTMETGDIHELNYDLLLVDVGRLVIEKQEASVSMIQRIFKVGYNMAARYVDQLEELGVIGTEEGTGPRRVVMKMSKWEQTAYSFVHYSKLKPEYDPYLIVAGKDAIVSNKASASRFSRMLRIGYDRAARITDTLEELGVVGPQFGTNPRKILMDSNEFSKLISNLYS